VSDPEIASSHPVFDAISSNYRPSRLSMFLPGGNCARRAPKMGRLRSTMQTLAAAAAFLCALSVGGPGTSHAAPSTLSETDDASRLPCNAVCKAYMAWSGRVSAMLHPSQPVAQTAVHHRRLAGWMIHLRASRTRQPGSNSLAQFPDRTDAAPRSAETSPAEAAPSRPGDRIADRFPAADGFVAARPVDTRPVDTRLADTRLADTRLADTRLAGTGGDVAETMLVSATRAGGPVGGLSRRLAVALFLALCTLSALVLWGWFRARTQAASAFPLMSDRTFAGVARSSDRNLAITKRQ
jgi:hypothetical protein